MDLSKWRTRLRSRAVQIRRIWKLYGGAGAIFGSSYFLVTLILMLPTAHMWSNEGWWDLPIQILPGLLGFSLGGYAILLTFGDDRFKQFMSRRAAAKPAEPASRPEGEGTVPDEASTVDGGYSLGMQVSATFVHFIVIQLVAIVSAVIAKSMNFNVEEVCPRWLIDARWFGVVYAVSRYAGWFVCFFFFLYALLLAGAAAVSVFRLSDWFDRHLQNRK